GEGGGPVRAAVRAGDVPAFAAIVPDQGIRTRPAGDRAAKSAGAVHAERVRTGPPGQVLHAGEGEGRKRPARRAEVPVIEDVGPDQGVRARRAAGDLLDVGEERAVDVAGVGPGQGEGVIRVAGAVNVITAAAAVDCAGQ